MSGAPYIEATFVGRPRTLHDDRGAWRSSIARQRTDAPLNIELRSIEGDRSTQRFHGGPDSALCVHLADHYSFWNAHYGTHLYAGAIGENLTLANITEDEISVGDIVRLGSVLAQVSGPRVPCANQARHVGREDWVALTIRENRTGLYMRVLEPGALQAGDPWRLIDRINEDASIPRINRCMYLDFDRTYAERLRSVAGLSEWWQKQAAKRLRARKPHWMETVVNS